MFELHPAFEKNPHLITLNLCQVLAVADSQCPWIILVPRRPKLTEIHDLSIEDQMTLIKEITHCTELLEKAFKPRKINLGALGNLTPQLHIHLMVRYEHDRAWPGPLWGTQDPWPKQSEIFLQPLRNLFNP